MAGSAGLDRARAVEVLNELMQLEYTGLAQYTQHGLLVRGLERLVWAPWFQDEAEECLKHARLMGEKVVALGGVPTVERLPVQQATTLEAMLRLDLDLERKAVAGYQAALDEFAADTPSAGAAGEPGAGGDDPRRGAGAHPRRRSVCGALRGARRPRPPRRVAPGPPRVVRTRPQGPVPCRPFQG